MHCKLTRLTSNVRRTDSKATPKNINELCVDVSSWPAKMRPKNQIAPPIHSGYRLLDEHGGQLGVLLAGLGQLGVDLIAQDHQLINLGDNAVLFG